MPSLPQSPTARNAILELDDVSILRGNTRILNHLSLSIPTGESCAILGPNGSGKSTLLKLLTRQIYPSFVQYKTGHKAGTVRIFDQTEWNVWDLRTQLGFVSGEIDQHFYSGRSGRLTAEQAVLTGFFSSELEPDPDAITDAMRRAAWQALEWMGMENLAQHPLGHMSTGERRRTLLARAIVHRPIALILDEPTSGLDLRAQAQLLHYLGELAAQGTTLILVTHHMQEILPCIQRTVLLDRGAVAWDGPTSEAMTADRLSQLFGCPLRVTRSPSGFYRVDINEEPIPD